jgi:hypothetical protein
MDEELQTEGKERCERNEEIHKSIYGRSRFARDRKDSSIESWLESKDEKKSKPASKGLSRSKGLVSRKRLNPVSKKQKKRNTEYKKAREEFYKDEANQKCFLCGSTSGLSIHHTKKRGNNISDNKHFVTLCLVGDYMDKLYPDANHSHTGGCHGFIEGNKSIARELKLL